jgi:predicted ester cyclase
MSIEENKAIARRFVEEMMNGQHVEKIDEFVAADAVHHEPRSGPHNYREALRNVFGDPEHGWRFVVDDVIAEGDSVVVRCTASYVARSDKGPYGIPYKSGTRASVWHAHFFRIQNGKIVEHWPVRDIWEAVRQFHAPVQAETATTG